VISRLLADPARLISLSLGATAHAANFGWDATARRTLEVYDWAIEQPKPKSLFAVNQ